MIFPPNGILSGCFEQKLVLTYHNPQCIWLFEKFLLLAHWTLEFGFSKDEFSINYFEYSSCLCFVFIFRPVSLFKKPDKIENYRHTEIVLTKCRIRRYLKLNFKWFDIGSGTNFLTSVNLFIFTCGLYLDHC